MKVCDMLRYIRSVKLLHPFTLPQYFYILIRAVWYSGVWDCSKIQALDAIILVKYYCMAIQLKHVMRHSEVILVCIHRVLC